MAAVTIEVRNLKGEVIFTGSREGLPDASLRGADLVGVELSGVDLSGADLTGADLRGAGLSGANLTAAILRGADLRCANLTGAALDGADLQNADLRSAELDCVDLSETNLAYTKFSPEVNICRIDFGGWPITINEVMTAIGDRVHENEKWLEWGPDAPEIEDMGEDAPAWWRRYGPTVKAAILAVQAVQG